MNQNEFARDWFYKHQNQIFSAHDLRESLTAEYRAATGQEFGDPGKMIRQLCKDNFLQRVRRGFFKYDPDKESRELIELFTDEDKAAIFERDGFRCAVCRRGTDEGVEVSVCYAKSPARGGKLDIENGRIFCSRHRFISETAQDSSSQVRNLRRLVSLFPMNDRSGARAQIFWEELVDLIGTYGVSEKELFSE